jgi:hypothetical protein
MTKRETELVEWIAKVVPYLEALNSPLNPAIESVRPIAVLIKQGEDLLKKAGISRIKPKGKKL